LYQNHEQTVTLDQDHNIENTLFTSIQNLNLSLY